MTEWSTSTECAWSCEEHTHCVLDIWWCNSNYSFIFISKHSSHIHLKVFSQQKFPKSYFITSPLYWPSFSILFTSLYQIFTGYILLNIIYVYFVIQIFSYLFLFLLRNICYVFPILPDFFMTFICFKFIYYYFQQRIYIWFSFKF